MTEDQAAVVAALTKLGLVFGADFWTVGDGIYVTANGFDRLGFHGLAAERRVSIARRIARETPDVPTPVRRLLDRFGLGR